MISITFLQGDRLQKEQFNGFDCVHAQWCRPTGGFLLLLFLRHKLTENVSSEDDWEPKMPPVRAILESLGYLTPNSFKKYSIGKQFSISL